MGNIFVLIFSAVVLAMLEVISVSAGLISILAVASLLMVGRSPLRSSVTIMLVSSLLIDPFYDHILGTYFISMTVLLVVHNSLKQLLPYDKLPIRALTLLLSFMMFHSVKMILIDLGQGGLAGTDPISIIQFSAPRAIIESLLFMTLYQLSSSYLGTHVSSVRLRPIK